MHSRDDEDGVELPGDDEEDVDGDEGRIVAPDDDGEVDGGASGRILAVAGLEEVVPGGGGRTDGPETAKALTTFTAVSARRLFSAAAAGLALLATAVKSGSALRAGWMP